MLDVSVSYNRYKFLGNEFLTWLWFVVENKPSFLNKIDKNLTSLHVGNRIVCENNRNDVGESITIKGDDAGLEEGILSLRKGAVVTELNLSYTSGDHQWTFTVKGESINISNLKTPETGPVDSKEDIEGAVIEKAYLYDCIISLINKLFSTFVKLRISPDWKKNEVQNIKKWILYP